MKTPFGKAGGWLEGGKIRGMERECSWQQDQGHTCHGGGDPWVGWAFLAGAFQQGNGKERDGGEPRDTVLSAGETEAGKGRWEEELLYLALWFSAAKASPQDKWQ